MGWKEWVDLKNLLSDFHNFLLKGKKKKDRKLVDHGASGDEISRALGKRESEEKGTRLW